MKKLMVMIGAAATALGLFAAGTPYSISFETDDPGVSGTTWTPGTGWTWAGDAFTLSQYSATDVAYTYGSGAFARRITGTSNANYLHLETASGAELKRDIGTDNVFLDQLVKFTGYEEDVDATTLPDGTKIALWLKASETDGDVVGQTNLCVTVGKDNKGTVTNLVLDVAAEPDKWYRVTVKNLGNIIDESEQGTTPRAGFIIYIDGQLVASADAAATSLMSAALTSAAEGYMAKGQLFPAIATGDTAFNTVAYTGTGSIEDIVIDETGPEFAAKVDFTLEAPENATVTSVKYADGTDVEKSGDTYSAVAGATLKIGLSSTQPGFLFPNGETTCVATRSTADIEEGVLNLEGDDTELAQAEAKKGTKYYLTLQKAVDSTEAGDVTVNKDVTLTARVDVASSVVINLNGQTIKPTVTCGNGSAFDIKSGATVVISNGVIDAEAITTIECDAITARAGADVTLDDLAITIDSRNGACAYAFADAKITIKSGTYVNKTTEDYEYKAGFKAMLVNQANQDGVADKKQLVFIEGGTFKGQDPATGDDSESCTTFVADGYFSKTIATSEYTVYPAIAKIGDTKYESVAAALAAVSEGDTVALLADVEEAVDYKGSVSLTFDLNGKTLTSAATATFKNDGTGSTITITATNGGKIVNTVNKLDEGIAVYARQGAITIKDGTFENCSQYEATVFARAAALTIEGGTFVNKAINPYQWKQEWSYLTLNVANGGTGTITVKGGTFTSNPANGDDSGDPTTFVANGYASTQSGDNWVVAVLGNVAKLTNVYGGKTTTTNCATLAEAVALAKDGVNTIELLRDVTLTDRVDVERAMIIDLKGFTITTTATCGNGSAFNVKQGMVFIKNGTIDGTAVTQTDEQAIAHANECDAITVRNGATVTLFDMNIVIDSVTGSCAYAFEGGRVNVVSGTYENKTTKQGNCGEDKMCFNQADVATQYVYVYGGTIKGKSPAYGDNTQFCTTFLAGGRTAVGADYNWTVANTAVAQVGDTTYDSLAAAFAAVEDNGTVTLLKEILYTDEAFTVTDKKNITLELNGQKAQFQEINAGYGILLDGTSLTIQDSVGGGALIKRGNATFICIDADSEVVLNSGSVIIDKAANMNGSTGACFKNEGKLTVNGGSLDSLATATGDYSISARGTSTTTINAGTIAGPLQVKNDNTGVSIPVTSTAKFSDESYVKWVQGGYVLKKEGDYYVVFPWAGSGTEADPYLIANANGLVALKDKVATYGSCYFKQTADIDLTGIAWEGIGIYKNLTDSSTDTGAFKGVYDGNNKRIYNIKFKANRKYGGFFNQVATATIKNVTLELADTGIEKVSGVTSYGFGTLIGYAYDNVTVSNVTTKGNLGAADDPITHTAGGFAVDFCGPNSIIVDCTNEVNVVCNKDKMGGFVGFNGLDGSYNVTLLRCVNKGTITVAAGGEYGLLGVGQFYGWSKDALTIIDCAAEGAIIDATAATETPVIGSLVGSFCNANVAHTLAVSGTTAPTNMVSLGDLLKNGVATGLYFATVADDVATFATPVAGGSYKVMAAGAAFELAAGESITLDETLATASVTTAAKGYEVTKDEGVYTASKIVYTITYDSDVAAQTYTISETATALSTPAERAGAQFLGWTNETYTTAITELPADTIGDISLFAKWDATVAPGQKWVEPQGDTPTEVQEAMVESGLTGQITNTVTSASEYTALQTYIKTKKGSDSAVPADLTANEMANLNVTYNLGANLCDAEITAEDVSVSALSTSGTTMNLEVSIDGVTPGTTLTQAAIEAVVDAKGGEEVGSLAAANVTLTGVANSEGKVKVTVAPKSGTPTKFFSQVILKK